ncbi:MAG: nitroreductase family protein [Bacteroidales bacterium]
MKQSTGIIHELLEKRRSPVIFSNKAVEEVKIMRLFEAARWAPSSRNEQPWRFIYATSDYEADFKPMFDCLVEGNKIWAKNVPLLILSLAKRNSSFNGKPNYYAMHDTGMAVASLLVQATDMGLYVHQMGGYDKEMARTNLNIPDEYDPVAMIAVGYLGNISDFPEELQKRENAERTRMPLDKILFRGRWKG